MDFNEFALIFLSLANETLAAAIVIIAVSMLLYNITRNSRDRVARTSGVVLAAISIAYVSDVLLSLEPSPLIAERLQRLQWIGIGLMPVALVHLSDALLETTGLPSRGRRRRSIRVMYAVGVVFILLAQFSNTLVEPLNNLETPGLRAGPLFPLYVAFFVIGTGMAFVNVDRARRRCLTRSTGRRMAYLQFGMVLPTIGIFPFSALLLPGQEYTLVGLTLVNIGNVIIVLTLLFLSYPLSFFGSRVPDRVVKTELLRFLLRGPATGLLILGVIIYTRPATRVLGLPGDDFMPFAVVAVVLFWQWMVDLWLPWLERRLIYGGEDESQLAKIQSLSRQLLTRDDLTQLINAILESLCDYLQVKRAFAVSFYESKPTFISIVGEADADALNAQGDELAGLPLEPDDQRATRWGDYWLLPLYSRRALAGNGSAGFDGCTPIGVIGIEAEADIPNLGAEERQRLGRLRKRAAHALDDLLVQGEIFAALEGLLPQITSSRERASEIEYKPGHSPRPLADDAPLAINREQMIEQVGAALRQYYGGPGMTKSRLLELTVVQQALPENDYNPVRALRSVLDRAIENQRPEGERDYRSQEWMLYNILQLRFIKKRLVRETARALYISDANLYRKQNLAIEAVTDAIIQMEQEALANQAARHPRDA